MDVTILVPTCGDLVWADLAHSRAIPSAKALGVKVVSAHYPDATLAEARNNVLRLAGSEWVIYLDADDELEPGYIDYMANGTADLRAPSVRYVRPDWDPLAPRMPRVVGHRRECTADCLLEGNWMVIGTAVRKAMIEAVGGWREWAVYEDWDLWLRCHLAGATAQPIYSAVYRAHVRPDSRNRKDDPAARMEVHRQICRANNIPEPA